MKNLLLIFSLVTYISFAQTQIGNTINGLAANDLSGSSIALSSDGSILAIGAGGNDDGGINSGTY